MKGHMRPGRPGDANPALPPCECYSYSGRTPPRAALATDALPCMLHSPVTHCEATLTHTLVQPTLMRYCRRQRGRKGDTGMRDV